MITASATNRLKSDFRGELLTRRDQGYDSARKVFNAMINRYPGLIARCTSSGDVAQVNRYPGLIARCTSSGDVAQVVNFAREQGALVSVRGAGHNIAGFAVCDEGIVIDLSPMKKIVVDPTAHAVRAEAGTTWGEVNDALQLHGLAATGGFVSVTGVSGLTLGGGLGWLVRKHGLALDNLLSAEIVLADGRLVTASASEK